MRRISDLTWACAIVGAFLLIGIGGAARAEGMAQARVPDGTEAIELGPVTNLPIPRYVSLRSSEINVRRGPGLIYRKDWVFRRAGLPVRVIDEYGDWRRIVDSDNAGGWVYYSLITGRRTVLINDPIVTLRQEPSETSLPSAMAEQGVIARLKACASDWCEIEAEGVEGWVRKASVWGVDAAEVFDR